MAQAFEDFDDYSTGTLPSPWSNEWGEYFYESVVTIPSDNLSNQSAGLGSKALRLRSGASTSDRRATEYGGLSGSSADEIYAVLGSGSNTSVEIPNLILRGGGTSEATRNGYVLFVRTGTNNFQIRKKTNGSSSTLASRNSFPDEWWTGSALAVRFSVVEDSSNINYSAKVWRLGIDDEVDAITISGTDTSPLSQGWLGIGHITVSGGIGFFGSVGFGTGGDSAPTEPVTAAIPTLSAPGVTDIGSTSVRPQVTLTY